MIAHTPEMDVKVVGCTEAMEFQRFEFHFENLVEMVRHLLQSIVELVQK